MAVNFAKLPELLSRRQRGECDEARRIAANIAKLPRELAPPRSRAAETRDRFPRDHLESGDGIRETVEMARRHQRQTRKGSSMKSTDDLPNDEGTMFIAWSPNANFAVSGRRGRDGELYVGSIYQDASMSTLKGVKHSIEQIKSTGVDVELVTGAEADNRLQMSGAQHQEEKPN
jgi:hypothetical protein